MGWKGTLRSVSAASNRAARESDRRDRRTDRSFNKVYRSAESILNKGHRLQEKLDKDVVKALEIKYSEDRGFSSKPFEMRSEIITGDISLLQTEDDQDSVDFQPSTYSFEGVIVEPLSLLLTRWATIVAFKVSHSDPEYRLRLNWVKMSNPSASSLFLLDESSSEYYYPCSSDLKGEVISGYPRIGIVAFEPFRKGTNKFSLQFSGVKLVNKRGDKHSFAFSYEDPELVESIESLKAQPRFIDQLDEKVHEVVAEAKKQILSQNSGCLVLFLAIASSLVAALNLLIL